LPAGYGVATKFPEWLGRKSGFQAPEPRHACFQVARQLNSHAKSTENSIQKHNLILKPSYLGANQSHE
jgi:hypothetical protein